MPETPTPSTPKGRLTWIETDPRGLVAAMRAGDARARSGKWSNDEASIADFRGLLLYALSGIAELSPNPPRLVTMSTGDVWALSPNTPAEREDTRTIQGILARGVATLCGVKPSQISSPLQKSVRVETQGGARQDGPTLDPASDTGAFPVLGVVAIVSVTAVLGAVLALFWSQKNEIEASRIASDERVAKHAATLAAASNLVESHVERERATGATLPWDDKELELFQSLKTSANELADEKPPPLQSVPDLGAVTKGAGAALEHAGEAAGDAVKSAGFGAGAVIAGAALLWLLSNEKHAA